MKILIGTALVALATTTSPTFAQTATTESPNRTERATAADPQANRESAGEPAAVGQPAATATTTRTRTVAGESGQNALEQHIAAALLLGNQEEVAISQFGIERAQNEQVKMFAQDMIEQHQQAISKVQQAAPQVAAMKLELTASQGTAAASNRTSATSEASRSTDTTSAANPTGNQRNASAQSSQTGGNQEMVQYMREVKEQCLSLAQQELSQKQGAEFDKCFMGIQISLHSGMLAHLRAADQHASAQMKPVIQEGTQMTEHHLAQAKQIMKQLDSAGPEGATAARPQPGASGASRQ